jgi:hypothetical protein
VQFLVREDESQVYLRAFDLLDVLLIDLGRTPHFFPARDHGVALERYPDGLATDFRRHL